MCVDKTQRHGIFSDRAYELSKVILKIHYSCFNV